MKTINVTFEDKEIKVLSEMKKKLSWHDFIMLMQVHCKEAIKRGDFEVE